MRYETVVGDTNRRHARLGHVRASPALLSQLTLFLSTLPTSAVFDPCMGDGRLLKHIKLTAGPPVVNRSLSWVDAKLIGTYGSRPVCRFNFVTLFNS
eukprot:3575498-Amphidinium_carterae.2